MGKLRDHMIHQMRLMNYSEATIKLYTKAVHDLAYHFNLSPLVLAPSQIQSFFFHLVDEGTSPAKLHIVYSAVKFFFKIHGNPHLLDFLPRPKRPLKIPEVLTQDEIERILSYSKNLRYKTFFTLIYSSGLRISEALNLQLSDIDISRKMILVKAGKGNIDRYAILSEKLIRLLQRYIVQYQPYNLLFFARGDKNRKMTKRFAQQVFKDQVRAANINKKVSVHTLRHSFATHLLENNTNLFYIMKLLGHKSIKSTMIYLHMQKFETLNLKSPLDIYDISLETPAAACTGQFELTIA